MAAMTAAHRTSGVMPLAVHFRAMDAAQPATSTGIVQPRGYTAGPSNITGVLISRVEYGTPLGNGTLAYTAATTSVTWAANGESAGAAVDIGDGGEFAVLSSGGEAIHLWVPDALPEADASDTIAIVDGGINADWSSFCYVWSFDDPGSGVWGNGATLSNGQYPSKNKDIGFNAHHVFESAGTYTVGLTVIDDMGGEHTYTESITVLSEPVGGWVNTYYFASAGNDDTGDGSIGNPFATITKAASLNAANTRFLFNRGDTFTFGEATAEFGAASSVVQLAAYGTGTRPIFDVSGYTPAAPTYPYFRSNYADVRFIDLQVIGDYPTQSGAGIGFSLYHNVLSLRCRAEGLGRGWTHASAAGYYYFIADCDHHNTSAYSFFMDNTNLQYGFVIVGSAIDETTNEALLRGYPSEQLQIKHCTFSNPPVTKNAIRILSAGAGNGSCKWVTCSENRMVGTGIVLQADNNVQAMPTHVVIEANLFVVSTDWVGGVDIAGGKHIVARNNRFLSSANIVCVATSSGYLANGYTHQFITVANNTAYSSGTGACVLFSGSSNSAATTAAWRVFGNCVSEPNSTTYTTYRIRMRYLAANPYLKSDFNLLYIPNANWSTQYLFSSVDTGLRLAEWQALGQDVNSATVDPSLADAGNGDLSLSEGSDCIDASDPDGAAWVRIDADGEYRDATPDIGAYEYPAVSAPTVTTTAASSIGATSATAGGNVTDDGGAAVTARGVCWSTTDSTPTLDSCDGFTEDGTGTGAFASTLGPLPGGTLIYINAYATNSAGTAYGTADDFATLAGDPASGASVSADGESLVLTWTREGGWPVDMDVFATAICTVLVAGTRNIQAEVGGIVVVDGETLTITRTLASLVYANETVVVVAIEAGTGYSEAASETIRTAAFTAGTLVTNDSAVANPDTNNGRLDRITRVNNRLALR